MSRSNLAVYVICFFHVASSYEIRLQGSGSDTELHVKRVQDKENR